MTCFILPVYSLYKKVNMTVPKLKPLMNGLSYDILAFDILTCDILCDLDSG